MTKVLHQMVSKTFNRHKAMVPVNLSLNNKETLLEEYLQKESMLLMKF